jgi:hypothetical protein
MHCKKVSLIFVGAGTSNVNILHGLFEDAALLLHLSTGKSSTELQLRGRHIGMHFHVSKMAKLTVLPPPHVHAV